MMPIDFFLAETITIQVDWFEQLAKGGWVVVVQGLLVVAMVAMAVERTLTLRARNFVPGNLINGVLAASRQGNYDHALDLCRQNPSTLSESVVFALEHRESEAASLSEGMQDIAQRGIDAEYEKLAGLSLIAASAPLLGLLGTMIGMIESFQLVALFGDEGGASLLADSIAKALITTAVGLIIALPALFLHHLFKRKIQILARLLEADLGTLHREWFLRRWEGRVDDPAAHHETAERIPTGTDHEAADPSAQ